MEKQQQQDKAWDLWLDCRTMQSIADEIGVLRKTADDWIGEERSSAAFATPPDSRHHFDLWQFPPAEKGDGQQSHLGSVPRMLNADRRHLDAAQRREVAIALRSQGYFCRAMGGALAVAAMTARSDVLKGGIESSSPD